MRALEAQRIVVTRAVHQAEELAAPLRDLGAEVILLPTIGIAPPPDPGPLRAAAASCNEYDWLIFTSANAVEAFSAELGAHAAQCTARVATVGAATRELAQQRGFAVSITPQTYVAESLVEAFRAEQMAGLRVLVPAAAVTRDVVAKELRQRGADVTVVEAYRNIVPAETQAHAPSILREPYPDWLTFTSSSAIENLLRLTGPGPLRRVKIATIGPVTSDTVRQHGLTVAAEATVHTIPGIVAALCEH